MKKPKEQTAYNNLPASKNAPTAESAPPSGTAPKCANRGWQIVLVAALSLLALILTFTYTTAMYLNLVLLPLLGVLLQWAFSGSDLKWSTVVLGVSYFAQVLYGLFTVGFDWTVLFSVSFCSLSFAYWLFTLVGIRLFRYFTHPAHPAPRQFAVKIVKTVLASVFIGGIIFICNALFSNPISFAIMDHQSKNYVKTQYIGTDYRVVFIGYDFIYNHYYVQVRSLTDDTAQFSVTFSPKNGSYTANEDDSALQIAQYKKHQAATAFASEVSPLLKGVMKEVTGVSAYDGNATLAVSLSLEDLGPTALANALTNIHSVLKTGGYHLSSYTVYAETKKEIAMVEVRGVTTAHIESGELQALLTRAAADPEGVQIETGISYFSKSASAK